MSILKKAIIVFLALGVLGILFLWWYASKHSMDEARSFAVNEKNLRQHVLIATQGSPFKDSVVADVVTQLKVLPLHISVIDVSQLEGVDENEWSAIVILHTWEMFEPQEDAKAFIDRAVNKKKLIVVSTSGSGEEMMDGVDGITSASLVIEIPSLADKIVARVKSVLNIP